MGNPAGEKIISKSQYIAELEKKIVKLESELYFYKMCFDFWRKKDEDAESSK